MQVRSRTERPGVRTEARPVPMLLLRRPSAAKLREFLAAQSKLDFTYSAVGATAAVPPAGYDVDQTRIKLGTGDRIFVAAKGLRRDYLPAGTKLQFRL